MTRKGKVPGYNFHPPRSQSWLRGGKAQLAAPSGPGLQILSTCHLWGSQAPRTQLVLRLLRLPMWWRLVHRLHPKRPLLSGRRDQDGGEAHWCLKAWAKSSGWPLKPCRTQPQSALWGSQVTHCASAGWTGGPSGKGWDPLLPHSPPPDYNSTVVWPSNSCCLIVSCFWAVQLLCCPLAEQDH